jgi:hypothetical protein
MVDIGLRQQCLCTCTVSFFSPHCPLKECMQSVELGFSSGSALQEGPTGWNYIWCRGPRQKTTCCEGTQRGTRIGVVATMGKPDWCCGPAQGIELGAMDRTGELVIVADKGNGGQPACLGKWMRCKKENMNSNAIVMYICVHCIV